MRPAKLKSEPPEIATVVLSSNADTRFVERAKKIGVRACVAKTKATKALVTAIETAIVDGDFVLIA
jgi:DNA-binding NarL/FixJ family response regulator